MVPSRLFSVLRRVAIIAIAALVAVGMMPGAAAADPVAGFSGTVTSGGVALEGADVHVQLLPDLIDVATTQTAPDGTYAVAGLEPGDYRLTFSATGHATHYQTVTLGGDPVTGVDVELSTVLTGFSGTITSAKLPSAGATVHVYAIPTGVEAAALTTDATGFYQVGGLEPGEYRVVAVGPGTTFGYVYGLILGPDPASGIDLDLGPSDGGYFSGQVATEGSGQYSELRVPSVVTATNVADGRVWTTTSTNAGSFSFTQSNGAGGYVPSLPPGQYVVHVAPTSSSFLPEYWENAASAASATPVTVAPNGVTGITANVAYSNPASISGTVTEQATGDPRPNEGVTGYRVDSGGQFTPVSHTFTDSNGDYELDVLGGESYVVCAGDLGWEPECWNGQPTRELATPVTLAPGGSLSSIDFTLVESGWKIVVRGAGAPGVPLQAWVGFWLNDVYEGTVPTDENGELRLPDLRTGDVPIKIRVSAEDPDVPGADSPWRAEWWENAPDQATATPIVVPEGAFIDLTFVLDAEQALTAAPRPTVTGARTLGAVLTANPGTWRPAPVALAYQWSRGGIPVPGATGTTYELTEDDLGSTVTVTVTGSKPGYAPQSKTSTAGAVVTGGTLTAGDPSISGNPAAGSTLTADAGSWGPGSVSLTYRWYRNGVSVSTGPARVLTTADAGAEMTVTVTGSRAGYTTRSASSEPVLVEQRLTTTPSPKITGTVAVGQTLTGSATAWGPGSVDWEWQWMRNGAAIPGALDATYELTLDDAGQSITVALTGSQPGYTAVTKTSAPKTVPLVFHTVVAPVITGAPAVGATLTASASPTLWSPEPSTVTYRWYRNGVLVSSGQTRVLSSADAGTLISVTATGALAGHTSATAESVPLEIDRVLTPVPTPTITGLLDVGQVLTANPGTWGPGIVDLEYQWNRAGVAIGGETDPTYELQPADAGATITVTVTGSKDGYSTKSKVSSARTIKLMLDPAPQPVIVGTPSVGTTLTVNPGNWGPAPVTLTYQWFRDDVLIKSGATYKVIALDVGHHLTVVAKGTKSGYSTTTSVSEPVTAG